VLGWFAAASRTLSGFLKEEVRLEVRMLWCLALTALAVRVPAILSHQALLPAVAPWGPLLVWLQPWIDSSPQGWIVLGLVGALADAASAVLLARLVERRRLADRLLAPRRSPEGWGSRGFWMGLAWAVHPVLAFAGGSAGAWQSLALLGLLSAVWNLEYSSHPMAERWGAWGMGLAVSTALWPLLLLPLGAAGLLSRRARARFYAHALWIPLLLALPWLLLEDPHTVMRAWAGGPSTLGLPGILAALWSAAGAPWALLQLFLQAWQWIVLLALGAYFLASLWRPMALLPGLALGAWAWILVAPQLQGPLLLAPLALALMVPGRFSLRVSAATFILLLLQTTLPGLRSLQLQQADLTGEWRATNLCWGALVLAWSFWVALEWTRLWAYARRDQNHNSFR
jgi:hypothetical protein